MKKYLIEEKIWTQDKPPVIDLLGDDSSNDDYNDATVKGEKEEGTENEINDDIKKNNDNIIGKEEGKENGNDEVIVVNKPSKNAGEVRENNSSVVLTPAKEKSVKQTNSEGTDENKKNTVIDAVINTDNIDDKNTGIMLNKLIFNTEFKMGNGTPMSTMSAYTPSYMNNIYSQLAQKEVKTMTCTEQ